MTQSLKARSAQTEFERHATERSAGVVGELFHFLGHTKKWWLTPIIVVLLLIGVLLVIGSAAPFIYTLF
jgi:Family of unknown function (DUF5989)